MTPNQFADVVWGIVGWAALVAVIQFMLLPTAVEAFRQRLFELRRELFLYMADGHIRPNHPAYLRLRRLLDSLLRFAERVTFLRIVMMQVSYDPDAATEPTIEKVIDTARDERTRAHLRAFHYRVTFTILRHIVFTSPAAWCLVVVVVPALAIRRGVRTLKSLKRTLLVVPARVRTPIRLLEDQADLLACA
jgi:hypothetical protein